MRRDSGTGSLYRRKDGLYVAEYNGRYEYSKDKATAKRKLAQMLKANDKLQPTKITVQVALDQYVKSQSPNLKARSVVKYQSVIDNHLRKLGTKRLDKLTALQIEQMYSDILQSGSSPSTVRLVHAVLGSAVKRCCRLQLLQTNVCDQVRLPKQQHKDVQVFTESEQQAVLASAAQDRLHALYRLLLTTGIRLGEALGLQVSDFDPVTGRLAITRTVHNGAVSTPKSKNSIRTLVLPSQACEALEATDCDSWFFVTSTGRTLSYTGFSKRWRSLLKRSGVEYRNPHVARHTVASKLLANGIPAPAAAKYLGHDVVTLLRTYAHALPSDMETVAKALECDV